MTKINKMLAHRIATRPVRSGLVVELFMNSLEAEGMQGKLDKGPVKLITSKIKSNTTNLLKVLFEHNPMNSQASQKIDVQAQPIEIVYHGKTVVQLVRCFALPPEMQLSKYDTFEEYLKQLQFCIWDIFTFSLYKYFN